MKKLFFSYNKYMEDERKTFEQLVSEKAGCFEFAWNGYIRIYEQGEEKCQCKECKALDEIPTNLNTIFPSIN